MITPAQQYVVVDYGLSYMDDEVAVAGPFDSDAAAVAAIHGHDHRYTVVPFWTPAELAESLEAEKKEVSDL